MIRLKELRKQMGLSQKEFASQINVAQNTVSNWELGIRDIDSAKLQVIADFFNITTDYLLGRTDNPSPIPQSSITPEGEKLLEKLKNLPPDRRKAIELLLNEEQAAVKSS